MAKVKDNSFLSLDHRTRNAIFEHAEAGNEEVTPKKG